MKLISILILVLLLSACGRQAITIREPYEVEVVRYETVPVPDDLTGPCTVAPGQLQTNQDLERTLADALLALAVCNAEKDVIKDLQ